MYWQNEIARGIIIGVLGSVGIICFSIFIVSIPSMIEKWVRKIVYSEIRGITADACKKAK